MATEKMIVAANCWYDSAGGAGKEEHRQGHGKQHSRCGDHRPNNFVMVAQAPPRAVIPGLSWWRLSSITR